MCNSTVWKVTDTELYKGSKAREGWSKNASEKVQLIRRERG
jgi:hypothetical protein